MLFSSLPLLTGISLQNVLKIELSDLELLEKPAESFAGLPLPQSITGADKLNHRRFMAGRIFKSLLTCAADPDLEEVIQLALQRKGESSYYVPTFLVVKNILILRESV